MVLSTTKLKSHNLWINDASFSTVAANSQIHRRCLEGCAEGRTPIDHHLRTCLPRFSPNVPWFVGNSSIGQVHLQHPASQRLSILGPEQALGTSSAPWWRKDELTTGLSLQNLSVHSQCKKWFTTHILLKGATYCVRSRWTITSDPFDTLNWSITKSYFADTLNWVMFKDIFRQVVSNMLQFSTCQKST